MPSRQDQLHSYQFMVQRVVSALVMRETDPAQSPFRRAASATMVSALIAVIIAAGFGVYGVFTGRGDAGWKQAGSVIIEEESGAKFLYRDDRLYPALNLASALLAAGGGEPKIRTVSRASLAGVPRGLTVGVANLPDSLPDKDHLLGLPWSVCSISGKDHPVSALALGGGGPAAGGRALPASEGVLVRAVSTKGVPGSAFLLWRGRLFAAEDHIATALNPGGAAAISVSTAFVNGLIKGQPLAEPRIDAPGQVSAKLGSYRNGQVIVFTDLAEKIVRYGVVMPTGLATITQLQATLLLGRFKQRNGLGEEVRLKVSRLSELPVAADLVPDPNDPQQPPADIPEIKALGSGAICGVVRDEAGTTEFRVEVPLDLSSRPSTASRSSDGAVYADYVLVPSGQGAVIAAGTTLSLVTDQGVRYAAARPEVLGMLGYAGRAPLRLPSSLVSLLPAGPGLDPQAALDQIVAA